MKPKLIAEIKKASPFTGKLVEEIDIESRVREYERLGASRISIVTADKFEGKLEWLAQARKVTNLPILQKDFITKRDQVHFARDSGVSHLLLIANLYPTVDALDELCFYTWKAGMKPVVEINGNADFNKAMAVDINHVLVNSRNMTNGVVCHKLFEYFAPKIPITYETTAASGISTAAEIKTVTDLQYDYVLIGEALMKSTNLQETIKSLCLQKQLSKPWTKVSAIESVMLN